ncbi:MAG: SDR family oxidoreductase [Hyphomonadaceae bacterium]|nr:SDR family oxidoreductase [Hyphomonadaceae bacterium]
MTQSPAQPHARTALVVGGSRGIGAGIVRRFAEDGASVVFTYANSPDPAHRLAAETGARGVHADSGNRKALVQAIASLGALDVAVINAGLGLIGDPLTLDADAVDRLIDVNIRGAYFAAVEAGRRMNEDGRIIILGSGLGNAARAPGATPYGMTKAAMQGLTRGLARDFGGRRITVNCIQPGPVDTDMNPKDGPFAAPLHAGMCIPRHATTDEIADLAAYLAGPSAAMITGAMLTIDGGYTC